MSQQLVNTILEYFSAVDHRDWDKAQALMKNPFFLDYSSFGGDTGALQDPEHILSAWKGVLTGFEHTHHQIGPLSIMEADGSTRASCYVTATHFIERADGGDTWIVYGDYVIDSIYENGHWLLTGQTFHFKFQRGNLALPELARQRVRALF